MILSSGSTLLGSLATSTRAHAGCPRIDLFQPAGVHRKVGVEKECERGANHEH